MTRVRKLPLMKLHELQPDDYADFYAQLSEKTRNSTHSGKPFFVCKFRDARRVVPCVPIWADSAHFEDCQTHWQPGHFYKIRGKFSAHERYGPQIEIEQIRGIEERDRTEGFSEVDFVETPRNAPEKMWQELHDLATRELHDAPLRQLVMNVLAANAEVLKRLPASPRNYYPFTGGWLEHTLSVARNCVWLADRYIEQFPELNPPLNRDLVIAGAILHDIGRVRELEPADLGQPPRLAIEGELFGHILLGRDLVREAARTVSDLNPELLRLLEHLLYAHLTRPEWGSPRLPCIPEVLIVHHADDLDAKFEMYARCLTRDTASGPFTDRDPILGRVLLKERKV